MGQTQAIYSGHMAFDAVKEQWGWDYSRPLGFWGWLADALWWALRKVGNINPHWGTVKVFHFEKHTESEDVRKAVWEAMEGLMDSHFKLDQYACVMGIEDYMRLMQRDRADMPFIDGSFEFTTGPFGYRGRLFNVPVHVVSTISGVAMIPRVIVETQAIP